MTKDTQIQFRIDKSFKILIIAYCKKQNINISDFIFSVLYYYFSLNDYLDIYKYREQLYHYIKNNCDEEFISLKADEFVNKLFE